MTRVVVIVRVLHFTPTCFFFLHLGHGVAHLAFISLFIHFAPSQSQFSSSVFIHPFLLYFHKNFHTKSIFFQFHFQISFLWKSKVMAFDTICKKKRQWLSQWEQRYTTKVPDWSSKHFRWKISVFTFCFSYCPLKAVTIVWPRIIEEIIRKLLEVAISYLTSPDSGWAFGKP